MSNRLFGPWRMSLQFPWLRFLHLFDGVGLGDANTIPLVESGQATPEEPRESFMAIPCNTGRFVSDGEDCAGNQCEGLRVIGDG